MPGTRRVPRRVTALLALAALGLVATACGGGGDGGSGEAVTLRFVWWGNDDRARVTEQALDLFERRHPNIKVETSFSEFNAYFQKLATEVAGGSAPDVLQMDYRYVREYADRGVLLELDEHAGERIKVDRISPALLAGGKVNGKLYALPFGQNTQVFVYDPEKWEAAGVPEPKLGWTWDEFLQSAARVTEASGGTANGVTDFGGADDWFEVWLRQQGKTEYTEDGKLGWTVEDLEQFWGLATRCRESKACTPPNVTAQAGGGSAAAESPLVKGQSAGEFTYDSAAPSFWDLTGKSAGLAPFPSSGGELGQYAKPSMLLSIAKRSEHPEEAAMLVDFLLNDAEAGKILGVSRGLPANSSIREAVGQALEDDAQRAVFEYEKRVEPELVDAPPPPPKGAGTIKQAFIRVYEDVMFGRVPVEEGAKRMLDEAEQALAS